METTKRNIDFNVLNQTKIEMIHEKSMDLLENFGMRVNGDRTINCLKKYGCTVDGDLVKFPKAVVDKALNTIPKELTLYNRDGKPSMVINSKNNVYFGTHSDQLEILDYKNNMARPFVKSDIKVMCKLASYLPNISFVLSVGLCADVNPKVQSQVSFIETLKNFDKTINFSTNNIDSLQEIIDIAAVVAGGHKELAEKPFIFNYCEPIPPLTHPVESTEKLFISATNGIPVVYMPYCMMGGTAPLSIAAALTQNNAEILAGVVITQAVKEGAPMIYGSMPTIFDMQTTVGSYAAPEFHKSIAAASELASYYNLPFYGTGGCSDAKTIDPQSVAEVEMELFSTILSKAHLVHDVGVLDHCNSVAPAMVVLANEMIDQLSTFSSGVEVTEKTLAMDIIKKVGHGGHYLNEMHTLKNFKSVWYPELFKRRMVNPDQSDILEMVNTKIDKILNTYEVPALDPAILAEIEKIEKKYQ